MSMLLGWRTACFCQETISSYRIQEALPPTCPSPCFVERCMTAAVREKELLSEVTQARRGETWKGKCRNDRLQLPQLSPDGTCHLCCARVVHPPGQVSTLSQVTAVHNTASNTHGVGDAHGPVHELHSSSLTRTDDLFCRLKCLPSTKALLLCLKPCAVNPRSFS